MMTMTMKVKFAGASADCDFTDIFWKPLNLKARGNVLEDRTRYQQEAREPEVRAMQHRAQDAQAKAAPRGLMQQDALSEMLGEMNLSTLLYYVLVDERINADESA